MKKTAYQLLEEILEIQYSLLIHKATESKQARILKRIKQLVKQADGVTLTDAEAVIFYE